MWSSTYNSQCGLCFFFLSAYCYLRALPALRSCLLPTARTLCTASFPRQERLLPSKSETECSWLHCWQKRTSRPSMTREGWFKHSSQSLRLKKYTASREMGREQTGTLQNTIWIGFRPRFFFPRTPTAGGKAACSRSSPWSIISDVEAASRHCPREETSAGSIDVLPMHSLRRSAMRSVEIGMASGIEESNGGGEGRSSMLG
mmetsp:Transcript_4426/g.11051  ORF Transcript_4426/g.11051 Transcript_4426/m.11051 type:complete len:202 (+) Transcript_4426:101-706(+)